MRRHDAAVFWLLVALCALVSFWVAVGVQVLIYLVDVPAVAPVEVWLPAGDP